MSASRLFVLVGLAPCVVLCACRPCVRSEQIPATSAVEEDRQEKLADPVLLLSFLQQDERGGRAASILENAPGISWYISCSAGVCQITVDPRRLEQARDLLSQDPVLDRMLRGEDVTPGHLLPPEPPAYMPGEGPYVPPDDFQHGRRGR